MQSCNNISECSLVGRNGSVSVGVSGNLDRKKIIPVINILSITTKSVLLILLKRCFEYMNYTIFCMALMQKRE